MVNKYKKKEKFTPYVKEMKRMYKVKPKIVSLEIGYLGTLSELDGYRMKLDLADLLGSWGIQTSATLANTHFVNKAFNL